MTSSSQDVIAWGWTGAGRIAGGDLLQRLEDHGDELTGTDRTMPPSLVEIPCRGGVDRVVEGGARFPQRANPVLNGRQHRAVLLQIAERGQRSAGRHDG